MKKGFTLVELIIYVAIFAILMLVITSFVLSSIKSNTKYQIKREVIENANIVMKTLTYELKQASSMYTPTSVFDTHPGQLSLETTQNLPAGEKRTYIDFYLDNGNIYIKREGTNPFRLNSANTKITNLIFERFKPNATRIQMTIEYANLSEYNFIYSLTSAVSIRY